jgi:hypothetical protein
MSTMSCWLDIFRPPFLKKWKTEKESKSIMLKGEFLEFTKRDFRRKNE